MQLTAILDQGEDSPVITTDFSTPAATEPSDAPGAPAPPGLADHTMAGSQVNSVGSDPAENVFGPRLSSTRVYGGFAGEFCVSLWDSFEFVRLHRRVFRY
jgi:hypothetical protein